MGKFSRIKLILKCNRLENEVQTLTETMQSEVWQKILKLLDVPSKIEERGWNK